MKLPCGCNSEMDCFHGPLIPRRYLKWGLAQIVENANGKIRLADPNNVVCLPDGSVRLIRLGGQE